MEKLLITGSNGFIGSHLIDFCVNKEYEIFGLDRPHASFNNLIHYTNGKEKFLKKDKKKLCGEYILILSNRKNLKFIECDIKNTELLERIIVEIKPKFIFHLAAQPYIQKSWEDPKGTIKSNVIGTINIFEPIKKYKIKSKVILACTSAEFGTTISEVKRPLKENDLLLAIHPYGISKIAAELLCHQYYINFGIESINVRFFNQTGIRRVNDASSDFIREVAQIELNLKEPIIRVGNLSPYRDFLGVKNTILGLWLTATKGQPGESYNICSGKKIQIRDLLNIVLGFSSKKIKVIEHTSTKLRKYDESIIVGDNSKIVNELGFEIIEPLEKTLKDMYDYWIDYYNKKEIHYN